MKKIISILTVVLLLTSCDDTFDINRDPDSLSPDSITNSTILPAGIAGLAGAQGSYYALIGGFWSQFWTQNQTSNQYKTIDGYTIGTNDFNGAWTAMYDALNDIRTVKSRSLAEGNWNYYLIATTLEIQGSQIMTDLYGDIPYTEANNIAFLQPKFETGADVYKLMIADLQTALAKDLSASVGATPANDDFIFGGNMTNWTKYANTLLLKLHIRLTEVDPALAESGIKALVNSGAQFLDVDAAMTQFEDAPDRSNPLFETDRRQLNTTLNLRASLTLHSYLSTKADPRLTKYYGPGVGLIQGAFETSPPTANPSLVTLKATTAVYFISAEESSFLQAEALERYFGGAGAKAKYDLGIQQAMTKYGADASPFIANGGTYAYPTGTLATKIEAIITQKWIASFPGNGYESFLEQNRTGYPRVSNVAQNNSAYVPGQLSLSIENTTGGKFPKRIVLPSNVKSRNSNAPELKTITTPIWWDVN